VDGVDDLGVVDALEAHEGVPLIVIQRQLGHSNLGITSIYLAAASNLRVPADGAFPARESVISQVRRQMIRWFVRMIVAIAAAYAIATGDALFGVLVGGIVLFSFGPGLLVMRHVPPVSDEDTGSDARAER